MEVDIEQVKALIYSLRPLFTERESALEITQKGAVDFVTQVDIRVQKILEEELKKRYPKIQFMGEEKDNSGIDFSGSVWILDPVDGTTNLIHDYRESVISLGLCEAGSVTAGVIYQPYTDEMFWAVKGKGAWLGEDPIHVSTVDSLQKSLIAVGTSPYNHEMSEENFKLIQKVFLQCSDIRRTGSAALDLAYVACGRTEAFFERYLKPWDFAAGYLLICEAGGQVTDFWGQPVDMAKPSSIVASNGIYPELIKLFANQPVM